MIFVEDIISKLKKNYYDTIYHDNYLFKLDNDKYYMMVQDQGVNTFLHQFTYENTGDYNLENINVLINYPTNGSEYQH